MIPLLLKGEEHGPDFVGLGLKPLEISLARLFGGIAEDAAVLELVDVLDGLKQVLQVLLGSFLVEAVRFRGHFEWGFA